MPTGNIQLIPQQEQNTVSKSFLGLVHYLTSTSKESNKPRTCIFRVNFKAKTEVHPNGLTWSLVRKCYNAVCNNSALESMRYYQSQQAKEQLSSEYQVLTVWLLH